MTTDIPAGYKLTEVGVIPGDWDVKHCKDVCVKIQDGTHFSPTIRGNDFLYVTSKNIRFGHFHMATTERIDTKQHEAIYKRCDVKRGDLLLTKDGANTGNAAINDLDEQFSLLSSVAFLRFDKEQNTAGYFLQQVLSSFGQQQIKEAMSGNAITRLTLAKINNLKFPIPPLPEQRAIATALSDVDALLAKMDALIAKKRDLKQATMQQLLTGQTRLPGFSGAWEVKRMKSLGSTYGGLTGKTRIDFGHGLARYIPFMNVMTSTVIDAEWLEAVDIPTNEVQNLTQKGDLFFNGSSETPEEVGFCSVLLQEIPNLYLNSFCFGFRFNADAKVNGLFFAYWFRSDKGRETMAVLAQGATRYNISKSAFLRLELPQPTQTEQTAIATILSDMDTELAALQTRRDKTHALKQGMMQALLTGRIRLVPTTPQP
jgi:type I restriction enzyme S subunit